MKNLKKLQEKRIDIEWLDRVTLKPKTVLYINYEQSVPILLLEILKELRFLNDK